MSQTNHNNSRHKSVKSNTKSRLKMSELSHYNNNEADFDNDHKSSRASPDTDHGGRESSISSSGSANSSSGLGSASDSNQSNSGRLSSTGNDQKPNKSEEHKPVNPYPNLVPETDWAMELVDKVRLRFLETHMSNPPDQYDETDLDELAKPLPTKDQRERSLCHRWITRFIDFRRLSSSSVNSWSNSEEITTTLDRLDNFLKFRRQFNLSHVLNDQFSKEIHLLHGIFPFGRDKQNLPMLYLRARIHRRWSPRLNESFQRYVAWQVDMITKSNHGAQVHKTIGLSTIEKDGSFGICFDCLGVSYSCLDMDFLRFLVQLLVNGYPTYCRYALCVDLPWLFRSVWKLVRSWLPEEAQKAVQLVSAKELTQYIHEDQIPNSIKFDERKGYEKPVANKHHRIEGIENIPEVDAFTEELNISSSELKQFKAHFDKVMKEYDQLGAI